MSKVGPTYTDWLRVESTNAVCIRLSIRHVLRSLVSYFVVCCFYHKIFSTTKLLNLVVPSVELMMQR